MVENLEGYQRSIALNAKELGNICKLIEPLTKVSIDEYGKCVYFTCKDTDVVEVRYCNNPYVVVGKVHNTSGKTIRDFAILVSTLKNLLSNGFSEIVFVDQAGELNIVFGDQLIYLETKNLKKDAYNFQHKVVTDKIDYESATYVFRTVGVVLNQTERASEKVIVIKDGVATFNTGVFTAALKSPFAGKEDMIIYKQVADSIATISDVAKGTIWYGVQDTLVIQSDAFYCEFPVTLGDKVNAFVSPSAELALKFDATIKIDDESLHSLVKLVQSLEYLSDTAKVGFVGTDMVFEFGVQNSTRRFAYRYPVTAGTPEVSGGMLITVDVLRVFLDITGVDVKYAFNQNGLGIKNDLGTFLIRKS